MQDILPLARLAVLPEGKCGGWFTPAAVGYCPPEHTMQSDAPRDKAYVALAGELDLSRRDDIAAALPDPQMVESVVINLVRATSADSVVMGLLVRFRRAFVKYGGRPQDLVITLPKHGAVRRAFELAGLTRLFAIAYAEPSAELPEEHIAAPRRSSELKRVPGIS